MSSEDFGFGTQIRKSPFFNSTVRWGAKGFSVYNHMYIPICENCNSCISSRINIKDFKLSKSNKRVLKINEDLLILEILRKLTTNTLNYLKIIALKDIKVVK